MPSIKREIRHLHVEVVQSRQRNAKKKKKKRDARAELLSIQPIGFLTFSSVSPQKITSEERAAEILY